MFSKSVIVFCGTFSSPPLTTLHSPRCAIFSFRARRAAGVVEWQSWCARAPLSLARQNSSAQAHSIGRVVNMAAGESLDEDVCVSPPKKRAEKPYRGNSKETSYTDYLCPICLQILIEPVVMPCKHELCKPCFKQNVEEASLQCPLCRKRISSWARKQARTGSLVNRKRWEQIQKLFPERCAKRLRGEDDDDDDDSCGEISHIFNIEYRINEHC